MRFLIVFIMFVAVSCQKDLSHEKHIVNSSSDTLTVINPDFDSVYTILPGSSAMIYSFEVLDTKQENENCLWLGDTLIIVNQDDSACKKLTTIEENWLWTMEGPEKERKQKCTFNIDDEDF